MSEDYKELVEFLGKKFDKIDNRFDEIKNDISEFKDDMYRFQDQTLKDLSDLKQEKTVSNEQDKRKTKVLQIHNNALKTGKILSDSQSAEIDGLAAF